MPLFDLDNLDTLAQEKKVVMEQKKRNNGDYYASDCKHNLISEEFIFALTLKDILEASNIVNSNIAFFESLDNAEVLDRESLIQTVKTIFDKYIDTFKNIQTHLNEKIESIKPGFTAQLEILQSLELKDDVTITERHYTYTNLGFVKNYVSMVADIQSQLGDNTNMSKDNVMSASEFRSYIRTKLTGNHKPIESKEEYLQALYAFFRCGYNGDEENKIEFTITREMIVDSITEIFYRTMQYFNHEVSEMIDYLKSITSSDHACNIEFDTNIVLSNIEIIFEEYALLYAARADAIIECASTYYQFTSDFVNIYRQYME